MKQKRSYTLVELLQKKRTLGKKCEEAMKRRQEYAWVEQDPKYSIPSWENLKDDILEYTSAYRKVSTAILIANVKNTISIFDKSMTLAEAIVTLNSIRREIVGLSKCLRDPNLSSSYSYVSRNVDTLVFVPNFDPKIIRNQIEGLEEARDALAMAINRANMVIKVELDI